ncbi:protein msta isoform X2 [Cephus cinctus]|uniref:Protein msta isoform X2 n=1 Tax=Cephus cinctus TaxID=211228 RepID=A0AAJ7FK20_CEPCN|nr:protein msta isoform X2 [Cephus cinctus]
MTDVKYCPICTKSASLPCSSCKNAVYCSQEHQLSHSPEHKHQRSPVKVAFSEKYGRYLIATRDLKAGELILRESPFILGPKSFTLPVCLGCHREFSKGDVIENCERCGWPVCSVNCSNATIHANECEVFVRANYKAPVISANFEKIPAYGILTPLRCLLLANQDKDKLNYLQGHLQERYNTPLYQGYRYGVVLVCAILDTNSFDVRGASKQRARAIYYQSAMMSHDCSPNTRHTFDPETLEIILYTTKFVPKGESLTATYTQTLWNTTRRRAHLKVAKCFDCSCNRCSDPTEFGTYAGSIKCSECSGFICSTNPLDCIADWKCNNCGEITLANEMTWNDEVIRSEIRSLELTDPNELEGFLERYKNTLHETNSHVIEVKYALTQLYSGEYGTADKIITERLERRIEFCRELLAVAEKLDAGATKWRGQLLLNLQEALVAWAKKEFKQKNITKTLLQENLNMATEYLKEAASILQVDRDLCTALPKHMKNLKMAVKNL